MVLWILYLVLRRLLGLTPGSGDAAKDVEIAVLRHQLRVLRRQVGRPSFRPIDRAFLAAAALALPRDRWRSFLIAPQTLLRWHRELVRRKWTYRTAKFGRPRIDPELREFVLRPREPALGVRANPGRAPQAWHPHRIAPGRRAGSCSQALWTDLVAVPAGSGRRHPRLGLPSQWRRSG